MKQSEVIKFFDDLAKTWDEHLIVRDNIINEILDNAKISSGQNVLDVACGTGVMFPYYQKRNVNSITGVDISSEMLKIAQGKFTQETNITYICKDICDVDVNKKYDCAMVYNAFPHFIDSNKLLKKLYDLLNTNGVVTIAHDMSRESINNIHKGSASKISNGLISIEELSFEVGKYFKVITQISNDKMYQIVAIKE